MKVSLNTSILIIIFLNLYSSINTYSRGNEMLDYTHSLRTVIEEIKQLIKIPILTDTNHDIKISQEEFKISVESVLSKSHVVKDVYRVSQDLRNRVFTMVKNISESATKTMNYDEFKQLLNEKIDVLVNHIVEVEMSTGIKDDM